MTLPRCSITDLPRVMCGCRRHADSFTMTREEREFLDGGTVEVDPPISTPRRTVTLEYLSHSWRAAPSSGVCDHETPDGQPLCTACANQLQAWLADIPYLLSDIEITLTRQDKLLQHGHRTIVPDPDESEMPWKQAASETIRALWLALGGRPAPTAKALLDDWRATLRDPHVAALYGRVGHAVAVAHRRIDRRAAKLFYGYCPNCSGEIWQERVDPDADPPGQIRHDCGYRRPLQQHQAAQLDLAEGNLYTVGETVQLLNSAGETVTASDVKNMIYRDGLPREKVIRAKWVDGKLTRYQPWAVRLRDVRDQLVAKRIRRNG